MIPIQEKCIQIACVPAFFIGAAFFAGSHRLIKYFPGASTRGLICSAGLGSVAAVGIGWGFRKEETDQNRRIWTIAGLILSVLVAPAISKKLLHAELSLRASFRFVMIEVGLFGGVELVVSLTCEGKIDEEKPQIKEEELQLNEQKLQEGIDISADTISKIQACMQHIIKRQEEGGVRFYSSQGRHRVFSIEGASEYVFKMQMDSSTKARYEKMVYGEAVCQAYQLGLLVIPRAKLFEVEVDGKSYEIIAEQKLDFNPEESAQEQLYKELAASLDETIRQLAIFICETGFSDVEWRNDPILEAKDEFGRRKIALIDIEEMRKKEGVGIGLFGGGFGRRGLIRCVTERQGDIVREVAEQHGVDIHDGLVFNSYARASAIRKEELEEDARLEQYHMEKGITRGDEKVQVKEEDLTFPKYPQKAEKLKALTLQLLQTINDEISKGSGKSVKGRRYIYVNINVNSILKS